ncbi:MAG: redox-regulated ATPase YchF [Pseudomonadota bacterium]
MGFNCGIVGLPNVGKSTLFNALSATAAAEVANYPFCTIEPNVGRIAVPDPRLDVLAKLAKSVKVVPTSLEFVDIAGLVRGASRGEGLGNKFLGSIREVDAILHVVRCFESGDVTHVEGGVDPVRDAETVNTELMLADLESLERRTESLAKKARGGDKAAREELDLATRALEVLKKGEPASRAPIEAGEEARFRQLNLLTAKPVLYVANVEETAAGTGNAHSATLATYAKGLGAECVTISAAIEAEVAAFESAAEREDFLATLGLKETGLARIIRTGYALLGLLTFFTAGPKETRAWTVTKGATAAEAAGTIHTDFARGFIAAATIAYEDFVAYGGEQGAKEAGKLRLEGRDYLVKDGDVFHFRFNV